METLLEYKEKVRQFYGKNEVYVIPVIRFTLALIAFLLINVNMGYMERLDSLPIVLILALICSILPVNAIIIVSVGLILAHLYALGLEVFVTGGILFVLIGLLYFRFAPKDGYYALLTPMCFGLRIPFVMPVAEGLLCKPYSIMSVASGTIAYYFLKGVKENAAVLGGTVDDATTTSKFVSALNQLIGNKEMYLVLLTFILVMVIVYVIRNMSIDHAWSIAIGTGILVQFTILFAGFLLLGISGKIVGLVVGSAISAAIAFALKFLFFHVDYTRTERVQFEDDEYYYYVKAVPKITLTQSQKKIKKFNSKTKQVTKKHDRITKEDLAKDMDIDKDLLK